MPNFTTTSKDVLDSVNYLLAGPQTLGQTSVGFWNFYGGYFRWWATEPPFIQDTDPFLAGPYAGVYIPDYTFIISPAYVFVNTTSSTDSVFVTSQLRPFVKYSIANPANEFFLSIDIYRYRVDERLPGWYNYSFSNPSKLVNYELIAQDNNRLTTTPLDPAVPSGNASFGETVFASIVDNPGVGRWLYRQELSVTGIVGTPDIEFIYGENIGLTATVIKI